MSPTPLIELQRRLAEAGRIRMGEKTDKGAPKRLTTWRITSPTRELIEQAAGLYGGEPGEWESPTGKQWEVVTTNAELPVLVMPGYSFRQGYEHRTSPTLVERRCDGIEMDDGKPCACNSEGFIGDECALITRLTVALPELTTMLGWRLETKGDNAAKTLLASMDLVQGVAGGRPFVPAKLRIVEKKGNKDGQAIRWVEPVIDVSIRYSELLAGGPERATLPVGYTPIETKDGNGSSLAEGLAIAETQTLTKPPRVELPEDDVLDEDPGASSPPPQTPDEAAPQATTGNTVAASTRDKPATKAQKDKLNLTVAWLRESGQVQTRQLWVKLANTRNVKVDEMIELLGGIGEDGELHWSRLRDSLDRGEASMLLDALVNTYGEAPRKTGAAA